MTSKDNEIVNDISNNSMFNVFSEGLNKLKLKTPQLNEAKNKSHQASTQNQDAQTSLADLEKLLSQLKTSNVGAELKEEAASANARLRSSINQDSKSVDNKFSKATKKNVNTSNSKINKSLSPSKNSQTSMADLMEQHPKLKMLSSIHSIKKDSINRSDIQKEEKEEDAVKNQNISSNSNEINKVSENTANIQKEINLASSKMKSKPPLPTETKANINNQRELNLNNPLSPLNYSNNIATRNNPDKRLEENNNDKESLISSLVNIESKPRAMTAISGVSGSIVYNKPKSNSVRPKISLNTQMINNELPNNNMSSIKSLYRYNPSELDKDYTIFSNLESNLFPMSPQSNINKLNESSIDFQNSNFNAYLNPAGETEGEAVPEREIELDNRNGYRQSKIDAEIKNTLSQMETLFNPEIKSKLQTSLNKSEINAEPEKSVNYSRKINEKNVGDVAKTSGVEVNNSDDKANQEEISSLRSRTPSPISNRIKVETFNENDIKMKNSVLLSNRGSKSQIMSIIKENINNASESRHSKSVISPDLRSKLHGSVIVNKIQHQAEVSKLSDLNITEKNDKSRLSELNVREKSPMDDKSKTSEFNIRAKSPMDEKSKISEIDMTQKSHQNEKSKLSDLNHQDRIHQNEKSKLSDLNHTDRTPKNEKSKISEINITQKSDPNEKSRLSDWNHTDRTPQNEKSKLSESNIKDRTSIIEKSISINNKSLIENKSNNNSAYFKADKNSKLSIQNNQEIEEKNNSIDILLYDKSKSKEGFAIKKLSSDSINEGIEKNISNIEEKKLSQAEEEKRLISEALNDSVILGHIDSITTEPENQIDASLTNRYRRVLARQLINASASPNLTDKQNKSANQNTSLIDNSKAPKPDTLNKSIDANTNKSLNKSKTSIVDEDELFKKVTNKLRRSLSPARSLIEDPKLAGVKIGEKVEKSNSFIKRNSFFDAVNDDKNNQEAGEAEKSKSNVKEISNLNHSINNNDENSLFRNNVNNPFINKPKDKKSKIEESKISITTENKNSNPSDSRINKIDKSVENDKKSLKNDKTREGIDIVKPINSPSYLNKSSSKIFNAFDFGVDNKNPSKIIANDNNIFNVPDFNNLSEINLDFKEPNQTNQSFEVDYDLIKFKNKDNGNVLNKSLNKSINENNHNQSNLNKSNPSAIQNKRDDKVTPEEIRIISAVNSVREEQQQDNMLLVLPANNNLNYATFETFFNKHEENDILALAPPMEVLDKEESFERPMKSQSKSKSILYEEGASKISDKINSARNARNSKINNESSPLRNNQSAVEINPLHSISNKVVEPVGNRSNFSKTSNNDSILNNNNNISFNEDSIIELNFTKADPIATITRNIPEIFSTKNQNAISNFNPAQAFNENLEISIEEIKMIESTPRNTETANLIADLRIVDENIMVKNSSTIAETKNGEIFRVNSINSTTSKRDGRTYLNKSKLEDKNSQIVDTKNKSAQNLSAVNELSEDNKNDNVLVTNSSRGRTSNKKREEIISNDINKSIQEMPKPDKGNDLVSKEISFDELNYFEKKFKFISIFDKDEEYYNQKIRDFDAIFMNVERYLPIRRRSAIMSNSYFKDYIMKEVNVFDKFKKNPKMFSENFEIALKEFEAVRDFNYIFQDVIGDDNNRKEETIEKLKKNNLLNYRIGALQKSNRLALHYNFEKSKSKSISSKFSNEISYFREIRCDGDSFYRSFMFSLFEYYILNQNIHEIKKLVLDIYSMNADEDTSFSKMKGIDFKTVLIVFHLILENLKKNNIQKAYEVFISAYDLEDISLDMVLIGYMRITLWMIANVSGLEKLQNSTKTSVKKDTKKEHLESGVESLTSSQNKIEMDKFSFDTILMYQNEPNKLVLNLSTLVFNVNLDVYVFDGSLSKTTSHELNYTKTRFAASTVNELPVINICYFLSNYYKVYDKQFSEKHNFYLLRYISNDFEASVKIGNKFDCDKCGKDMKKIYLKKYSMMSCYECIKSYLDKLIEKRAQAFFIEDFNNREFYCRGFEIKEDVFLDEDDIYEIYGTNIANLLMSNLKESCIVCKKKIAQKSDIINLECGCILCKTCLKASVEQATNGQIVQNAFEKKCKYFCLNLILDKRYKMTCLCDKDIDIDAMIKLFDESHREMKQDAKKRLEEYASHYCMCCCNRHVKDGEEVKVKTANSEYHQFAVLFSETESSRPKDMARVAHVLCNKCVQKVAKKEDTQKSKMKGKGAEINIKPNYKTVYCNICLNDHYIAIDDWNKMHKKPKCAGCLII